MNNNFYNTDFSSEFTGEIIKKVENNEVLNKKFNLDTLEILWGIEFTEEKIKKYSFLLFYVEEKKKIFWKEDIYILFVPYTNIWNSYELAYWIWDLQEQWIFFIKQSLCNIDIEATIFEEVKNLHILYNFNELDRIEKENNLVIECIKNNNYEIQNQIQIYNWDENDRFQIFPISISIFYKSSWERKYFTIHDFLTYYNII